MCCGLLLVCLLLDGACCLCVVLCVVCCVLSVCSCVCLFTCWLLFVVGFSSFGNCCLLCVGGCCCLWFVVSCLSYVVSSLLRVKCCVFV